MTNLIFSFSLWRAWNCIQTAEVTKLSVSLFYTAFWKCYYFAGDSACFHCVLWSLTQLESKLYFERNTVICCFSFYLMTLCNLLRICSGKCEIQGWFCVVFGDGWWRAQPWLFLRYCTSICLKEFIKAMNKHCQDSQSPPGIWIGNLLNTKQEYKLYTLMKFDRNDNILSNGYEKDFL